MTVGGNRGRVQTPADERTVPYPWGETGFVNVFKTTPTAD